MSTATRSLGSSYCCMNAQFLLDRCQHNLWHTHIYRRAYTLAFDTLHPLTQICFSVHVLYAVHPKLSATVVGCPILKFEMLKQFSSTMIPA